LAELQAIHARGYAGAFPGQLPVEVPADFQMVVGPTHSYPVPHQYLLNTERYSQKVQIKTLHNGMHILENYVAGAPFPQPEAPMKGYKIFTDAWYSYVPYIACGDQIYFTMEDRFGNVHRERAAELIRRFSHISDPAEPVMDPAAPAGIYMTEYIEVMEPEESRYTGQLAVWYEDVTRDQDLYFLYQRSVEL
jgi:hypothetical protein